MGATIESAGCVGTKAFDMGEEDRNLHGPDAIAVLLEPLLHGDMNESIYGVNSSDEYSKEE
jgi:hypothetical protein